MKIKVSIIVPIYNVEKYLSKCIESICNQTLEEIEIILVNDGSTDKSLEIIEEYKKNDSRIRVINQKNKGVSIARNNGLKIAKGEYIAFVDPDDWIDKNMYEVLYLESKSEYDVVLCDHTIKDKNRSILKKYEINNNTVLYRKEIINEIVPQFIEGVISTTCWDKIYKRAFLEKNKLEFKDIRRIEDLYFFMDILNSINTLVYVPKSFYNYRIVDNSLSRRYYENYIDIILELHINKLLFINKINYDNEKFYKLEIKSFIIDIFNVISKVTKEEGVKSRNKIKRICTNEQVKSMLEKNNIVYFLKNSNINKVYAKTMIKLIINRCYLLIWIYQEIYFKIIEFKKIIKIGER